jgi:peroxiredoxin
MQAGIGLAVASLVLGLVSLPLSVIVIGAAAGLAGLIVAVIHLCRGLPFRAMAVWGLVLSIAGTVLGAGFILYYMVQMRGFYSMMEEEQYTAFEQYIGRPAPELEVKDLEGNPVKLSELRGRRVVLVFWATWCPPCREEVPHLVKLRETVPPSKLAVIGISSEPPAVIEPFAEKHKINYTLASAEDRDLEEPYGSVTSIPTTFFIDKEGVIQDVVLGSRSFEHLKAAALGEEAAADE